MVILLDEYAVYSKLMWTHNFLEKALYFEAYNEILRYNINENIEERLVWPIKYLYLYK